MLRKYFSLILKPKKIKVFVRLSLLCIQLLRKINWFHYTITQSCLMADMTDKIKRIKIDCRKRKHHRIKSMSIGGT